MNRALIATTICWTATLSGCIPSSSDGSGLDWGRDLSAALETARREDRPVLLNFGGPW